MVRESSSAPLAVDQVKRIGRKVLALGQFIFFAFVNDKVAIAPACPAYGP